VNSVAVVTRRPEPISYYLLIAVLIESSQLEGADRGYLILTVSRVPCGCNSDQDKPTIRVC